MFRYYCLSTRLVDRSEMRNSLVIGTTIQVTTVRGHKCSAFHGTTVTTFYWHQVLNIRPWYVHENYPQYSLFPTNIIAKAQHIKMCHCTSNATNVYFVV